jgi:hypothetical protein
VGWFRTLRHAQEESRRLKPAAHLEEMLDDLKARHYALDFLP